MPIVAIEGDRLRYGTVTGTSNDAAYQRDPDSAWHADEAYHAICIREKV